MMHLVFLDFKNVMLKWSCKLVPIVPFVIAIPCAREIKWLPMSQFVTVSCYNKIYFQTVLCFISCFLTYTALLMSACR